MIEKISIPCTIKSAGSISQEWEAKRNYRLTSMGRVETANSYQQKGFREMDSNCCQKRDTKQFSFDAWKPFI